MTDLYQQKYEEYLKDFSFYLREEIQDLIFRECKKAAREYTAFDGIHTGGPGARIDKLKMFLAGYEYTVLGLPEEYLENG